MFLHRYRAAVALHGEGKGVAFGEVDAELLVGEVQRRGIGRHGGEGHVGDVRSQLPDVYGVGLGEVALVLHGEVDTFVGDFGVAACPLHGVDLRLQVAFARSGGKGDALGSCGQRKHASTGRIDADGGFGHTAVGLLHHVEGGVGGIIVVDGGGHRGGGSYCGHLVFRLDGVHLVRAVALVLDGDVGLAEVFQLGIRLDGKLDAGTLLLGKLRGGTGERGGSGIESGEGLVGVDRQIVGKGGHCGCGGLAGFAHRGPGQDGRAVVYRGGGYVIRRVRCSGGAVGVGGSAREGRPVVGQPVVRGLSVGVFVVFHLHYLGSVVGVDAELEAAFVLQLKHYFVLRGVYRCVGSALVHFGVGEVGFHEHDVDFYLQLLLLGVGEDEGVPVVGKHLVAVGKREFEEGRHVGSSGALYGVPVGVFGLDDTVVAGEVERQRTVGDAVEIERRCGGVETVEHVGGVFRMCGRRQRHGGRLRVDDDDTLRHSACIGHSEDGLREVKPGIRLIQRYLILGGKGRFVVVISVGFQGFELEPVGSGVFAGGVIQRGHEADTGMGVGGEATFRLLGVHTHGDGVGFGLVGRTLCGEYIAHHEVGYLVLRVLSVQGRVLPVFYVEGDFEVVLVGIGDAHGVAVVVGDVEV